MKKDEEDVLVISEDYDRKEEAIIYWAKHHPLTLLLELIIVDLMEWEVFTEEEGKHFLSSITQNTGKLEEKYQNFLF